MAQKDEFLKEQAYLQEVRKRISERIGKLEVESREAHERVRKLYDIYTLEDSGFYLEIPMAEDLSLITDMDLYGTKRAADKPYFGKIVFTEDHGGETTLYVGKKSFFNPLNRKEHLPIIDWRVPVAAIYYDSHLGPSQYSSPSGTLEVELKQKRTLKIRNGELTDIYDLDVVSDDDLLLEYLSQNKDVVLGEIVATIQRDQNRIIRRSPKNDLVVQGVAGSGKTTVLLHRISYLLYNYKDLLNHKNILLIAANPLFLNYITSMLPDLDVPDIKQGTMDKILTDILSDYDRKVTAGSVQTGDPPYDNRFFADRFHAYIRALRDRLFPEDAVTLFGFELLSAVRIRQVKSQSAVRLQEIAAELDGIIGEVVKKKRELLITYMSENRYDVEVQRAAEILGLPPENMFEAEIEKRFSRVSQRYTGMFRKRVKQCTPRSAFREFTGVTGNRLTLCDIACYLLFIHELCGITPAEEIRHIVIDEAQDFSIVIYACLKALYAKATFSLAGDIMQNIRTSGLQDWTELLGIFPSADYETLYKSYRNTIEISLFAKNRMERLTGEAFRVEPIVRHGEPVALHRYAGTKDRLARLIGILGSLRQDSITAVICRTEKAAKELFEKADESCELMLLCTNDASLRKGRYVMSVGSAKGLEFDSVVLWDFDDYSPEEYKALYVAATRALHRLHVFTNKSDERILK